MIRQLVRCTFKWCLVVGDVCVCVCVCLCVCLCLCVFVQYMCLCIITLTSQWWHDLRSHLGPLSSVVVYIDRNAAFTMQILNTVYTPEPEKYHSRLKLGSAAPR